VLVLVSAGGEELWMLLDTGAQLSILRPEAARRIGGRVNAAVVEWPPLRLGEYVIEHLIGGIAALPEFPITFDGVIGATFIEAARITLDYRARERRLDPAR
jgi:hypothetical protein